MYIQIPVDFLYQPKELKFGTQIIFAVKSKFNFPSTNEKNLIPTQLSQSQLSLTKTPSSSELSLAYLGLVKAHAYKINVMYVDI